MFIATYLTPRHAQCNWHGTPNVKPHPRYQPSPTGGAFVVSAAVSEAARKSTIAAAKLAFWARCAMADKLLTPGD